MLSLEDLPNDLDELKKFTLEIVEEKNLEISRLSELLIFFRRRVFGKSSEVVTSEQLGLFNEVEETTEIKDEENNQEAVIVKRKSQKKPGRKPLPENLEREVRIIDLDESKKHCACGAELKKIGEESSESVEIIPVQIKVIETRRPKYACPCCSQDKGIQCAEPPKKLIPKSFASASLLAFIIVSKFCDHLPFYRQTKIFSRFGIDLSRATMAAWMMKVAKELQPLFNLLHEEVLASDYICMDETRVQVLREPGKTAQSRSYMWVYGREGPKRDSIVLFEYDPTRSKDVAHRLLDGYEGYLQVDGYSSYDELGLREEITRVGCMAHLRRKFHDAWIGVEKAEGKAEQGLKFIKKLYQIEERIKNKMAKNRYEIRQKQSKPILDEMKSWIEENSLKVPKDSLIGKAFTYALNEWSYLINYLEDGRLSIDNNFIENKIRPFALGRRNWLFSTSVEGAKSSAVLYSIVQTAIANGFEPWKYLSHILEKLPHAQNVEDYEALIPIKSKFKM